METEWAGRETVPMCSACRTAAKVSGRFQIGLFVFLIQDPRKVSAADSINQQQGIRIVGLITQV